MTYLSKIKSYLDRGLLDKYSGNPYFMVSDCETTGYSEKQHDLISFSGSIHDYNLDKKDEITVYAKPKKERWTEQAAKVHGFTLKEALDFPSPRKSAIELLHFLKPFKTDDNRPILFISHDTSGFDSRFFKAFFLNQLLIESYFKVFKHDYRLSTVNIGRKLGYNDNKLKTWADLIGFDLNHHEVESDRNACFETLKYQLDKTEAQVEIEIKKDSDDKKTPVMQGLQEPNS